MTRQRLFNFSGAASFLLLFTIGCENKEYTPPPPPSLTVAKPAVFDAPLFIEATGTTEGIQSIDLRARVKGFLDRLEVVPGQRIEKDTPVYLIDPREYQIALNRSTAELQASEAALAVAQATLQRQEQALAKNAISELSVIQARADRDRAIARRDETLAMRDNAQLNLDFTRIRAPFPGRIGQNQKNVGDLVGAGEYTLLGTLIDDSSLYVKFEISENDMLEMRSRQPSARPEARDFVNSPVLVQLAMANETDYPHTGRIESVDNSVDATTGTFQIRAVFPNPDGAIMTGAFVRLRVVGKNEQALVVPSTSIMVDQAGSFVYSVNAESVVERREVTPGRSLGNVREIRTGISASDSIIINGLQRARPGLKVAAKESKFELPSFTATAASAGVALTPTAAINPASGE